MHIRAKRRTLLAANPMPTIVVDKLKGDEVIGRFYIQNYAYILLNCLKHWDENNADRFEIRFDRKSQHPDLMARIVDTQAHGIPTEIGQCKWSAYAHLVKNFLDVNAPGRYRVIVMPGVSEAS